VSEGLQGAVVVVTGGAGGIGSAICRRLAHDGATPVVADLDAATIAATTSTIERDGGAAVGLVLDVRHREQVDAVVARVVEELGGVDALVNCAGVTGLGPTATLTDEQWDEVMQVNLRGAFLCARACFPHLQASPRAALVNITSLAGVLGQAGGGAYGPSKAGLMALTKGLAEEWGRFGIRVNAVTPGAIVTPLTRARYGDPIASARRDFAVPLGRPGNPEDVASVVAFLLSNDAGYVSGEVVTVDGGFMAAGLRPFVGPHFGQAEGDAGSPEEPAPRP
jgi:3-oxoacyl-[acyl-carrier protein] reductase